MKLKHNTNELEELKTLKKKVEKSLKTETQGTLRTHMAHGKYPQYYHVTEPGAPRGHFLQKSEIGIAKKLAQKEYDQKIMKVLERNERKLMNEMDEDLTHQLVAVYQGMSVAKQMLIKPYVLSDEEYLEKWLEEHKGGQNGYSLANGFQTERREYVRSKSEKIIADKLFYKKMPYSYEAALELEVKRIDTGFSTVTIYPDFTILNLRKRKTYYLEHLGLMDNPEYCRKALERIDVYENNHIYLGDTLFISMESSQKSFNVNQIDSIIERILT
ncbi:MAG: hypothetical protein MJ086_05850 [Lachnospiraceae bacterium]|nr:hypothetical protein [Lachnospiraceae bacterium]